MHRHIDYLILTAPRLSECVSNKIQLSLSHHAQLSSRITRIQLLNIVALSHPYIVLPFWRLLPRPGVPPLQNKHLRTRIANFTELSRGASASPEVVPARSTCRYDRRCRSHREGLIDVHATPSRRMTRCRARKVRLRGDGGCEGALRQMGWRSMEVLCPYVVGVDRALCVE